MSRRYLFLSVSKKDVGMDMSQESEILREIEEEVKKLLREGKSVHREKTVIHYFSLKRGNKLEEILGPIEEDNIVLVSFEDSDLENVRERISILARKVSETGGKAYFIKWPTLLLVRKDVEFKIHK